MKREDSRDTMTTPTGSFLSVRVSEVSLVKAS
jgi:hypothetical protein